MPLSFNLNTTPRFQGITIACLQNQHNNANGWDACIQLSNDAKGNDLTKYQALMNFKNAEEPYGDIFLSLKGIPKLKESVTLTTDPSQMYFLFRNRQKLVSKQKIQLATELINTLPIPEKLQNAFKESLQRLSTEQLEWRKLN